MIDSRDGTLDLRELWEFRELLHALVLRDFHVRYRQSLLGVGWVLLQPLVVVLVTTLAFGRAAHFSSDQVPYPLFALAALVPWNYFSRSLTQLAECLVNQRHILTKIYFPRLILPLSAIICALLDCAIGFALLFVLMLVYRVPIFITTLWVPFFILLLMFAVLGIGLWLAPLNALYRDFQAVLPFLLQVGLFATPIIYSSSILPEQWREIYRLNPLVFIMDGLRAALFQIPGPSLQEGVVTILVVTLLFITGLRFFLRMENNFVDVV